MDVISLDHDLGWGNPTGYDVVLWIIEHHKYPKEIYLHSSSPSARVRMYEQLLLTKPAEVLVSNMPVPEERLQQIARRERN
ncbi:hypothetical protein D3C73_1106150 [compost metagenome]